MQRLAVLLGTLALTATVLPAQEKAAPPAPPAAVSTDMLFFKGENAQLPDSAKSILESRLPAIRQDAAMRIVILDYGSSKDSMLVFTRLYALKGYFVTKGVKDTRIDIGTRASPWVTDHWAAGPYDPKHTTVFVLPSPDMIAKQAK
ncbi:MAG TPA: hypothetical protein VLT79_05420 [Gemmatimonadales bacterium]|nr:hypothetical protein [Gemmatimonadales bacterium]